MSEVGQIKSPTLRAPLTVNDMNSMDTVKNSHQNITNWYKENS